MTKFRLVFLLLPVLALALFAGCGSSDDSSSDDSSTTTASVSLDQCQADSLDTYKDGVLTVATDDPAYSPYFEDNDPTNGKGFESAVAYAVAGKLGFNRSQVEWTTVPFNSSYAPGDKQFDFDVNQISITPPREKVVDFSAPYYEADQAVLVKKGGELDGITSLDQLKDATIGVQIGTTSLDAVNEQIDPATDPKIFDNSNDVVSAFKNDQVDAIVVDTPTAIYLRDAELSGTVVAGQFAQAGGDQWGAVLDKDSSLTDCVSAAIDSLKADGTLDQLNQEWMSDAAKAPELN